ncbi:MAG: hypothetical protein JWP40_3726, partial [Blastococcus sp.]|nr:hypothetical protein [Blastococcus sp.]
MVVVRLFVAVPQGRFSDALSVLGTKGLNVTELGSHRFSVPPRYKVIAAAIARDSSRYAAQNQQRQVASQLQAAGIPYRLLAVDPAAQWPDPYGTWHVLRQKKAVGPVRRAFAQIPGVGDPNASSFAKKLLRRILASPVLGTSTIVTGQSEAEANRNRRALHEARGEAFSAAGDTWILEQIDNPNKTPRAGSRGAGRLPGGVLVGWGLVLLATVLLAVFGLGWALIVALAIDLMVVVIIFVQLRSRGAPAVSKHLTILLGTSLGAGLLAAGLIHPALENRRQATITAFDIGILLAVLGLTFQMRRWRAGRFLPWVLPIVIGGAAALTPMVGWYTYAIYLDALNIPYRSASFSTREEAIAGVSTMIYWIGFVAAGVGLLSLWQWLTGPEPLLMNVFAVLIAVSALLGSLTHSTNEAHSAALAWRSQGSPDSWYAIDPTRVCVTTIPSSPSIPASIPIYGNAKAFRTDRPHYLLGDAEGSWLLWDSSGYW